MDNEQFIAHQDCKWFSGEKPCRFKRLCRDCPEYSPISHNILVVKLAALGDVLRTTCLLPSLARAYPRARITWITDASALPLLACAPGIDLLLPHDFDSVQRLTPQRWDLAICLDKEPRAISLIEQVQCEQKRGFGMNAWGTPRPLNPGAEYAYRLGLDDELKFVSNQLTYQQIIHQAVGLEGPREAYVFEPPQRALEFAEAFFREKGLDPERTVGIFTGAGPVFAHKAWLPERLAALADWLRDDMGLSPLLLGGPAERELNKQIAALCQGPAADSGGEHDLIQFAGLAGKLRLMVTSDSLPMHLALAQKTPTVALFGSTCAQEIMLTAPGRLLGAGLDCQPCYRGACDRPDHCMKALSLATVQEAVQAVLKEL